LLFESIQFRSVAGPSALNGIVSSSITPTISYNTVNNPVNPTGGKSYFYSAAFTGGPLGGNVKTISNVVDWKYYHPTYKHRNTLGFHASAAYITAFGNSTIDCTTSSTACSCPNTCTSQVVPNEIPPYSRFYMGGESDIRGFDIRSISPVTYIPEATTQTLSYHDPTAGGATRTFTIPVLVYAATLPGGDLQGYGNFEYRIPIVGPVTAGLFLDGGTTGILKKGGLQLDPTGVRNINDTFFKCSQPNDPTTCPHGQYVNGAITGNLPIASGTNFRVRGSTGVEFVVQLPIIQAPFRIYYAFNLNRFHEQLVAQNPFIKDSEIKSLEHAFDSIDPTIFPLQIQPQLNFIQNSPGRLNYFEPLRTFRFTVSRTF
jgi:outer membrane protein insertion porin family